MEEEVTLHFRDELRVARAAALRDAEAFHAIVLVLERLGGYLEAAPRGNLGIFRDRIAEVACRSPMSVEVPSLLPEFHSQFITQYEMVREARNAAFHEGALARHLTVTAVQLSLVLEEALMHGYLSVGHFMVRNPVCAYLWQPLSFVRQTMLVNSFSFLPVPVNVNGATVWKLVSDLRLAQYLRKDGAVSKERLVHKLQEALDSHQMELLPAPTCSPDEKLEAVLRSEGLPTLVLSSLNRELLGIVTPFDLL
jgi:hypothetical protein